MSQQASIWSRFLAAALQTHGAEAAAKKADEALAEYNKRFETLAKYETELMEMARDLEARDAQVFAAVTALLAVESFLYGLEHSGSPIEARVKDVRHQIFGRAQLVENERHEWVLVPNGWPKDDPRLPQFRKHTP